MKPRRKILKILLALFAGLLLAGLTAFFFPQQVLTVDSGPVKADVLIVLGGTSDRAMRAVELFKAGEAPLIICTGYGDADANEAYLTNSGVTKAAIWLEPKSRTTRENAKLTITMLHAHHLKSAIIVTSWYHSRRALACFEHYAPDIKFYSRPAYFGYLRRSEDGRRTAEDGGSAPHPALSPIEAERVRAGQRAERKAQEGYMKAEYVKLLGYWVCYGVCPL
jgi:uncharacterized SAM-binding protein YcdF (DUF218 family)